MRILMLSNLCPPYYLGGYEIGCLNVARALDRRGHEIRLLTTGSHVPGPPDPAFVDRRLSMGWFDPYPLPGSAWNGAGQLAAFHGVCSDYGNTTGLVQALRDFRPDLVYCWNPLGIGGLALMDMLNTVGVPWVLHLMDVVPDYMQGYVPAPVRHIFNAGGGDIYAGCGVITMAQHILDMVEANVGIRFPQGAAIIPGWVDTTGLGRRTAYRVDGQTRFVTAGTVAAHKGTYLIVQAAASLRAQGREDFAIDVFGEGQVDDYVAMAARLGVGAQVRFLGGRPQRALLESYAGYDAFLFPTREQEPFGFAPIEAAASGCVPIMTANCGAAERMVGEVHCLKIERSSAALAASMARVITGAVDLTRIGAAGAALVASDLSEAVCMGQIEAVLAAHARPWSHARLDDPKLLLLAYIKHHLARGITLGIDE
jgi:glycogen(starch) synthase